MFMVNIPVDTNGGCHVRRYFFDWQHAICGCGYRGKRRRFLARAKWDARRHAAKSECLISYPLVRNVG